MKVDIVTIFPHMFKGPFDESIIKRAQEKGLVDIKIYDLRQWAKDKHKTVDDRPYGGGAGMVMMVEPIDNALKDLKRFDLAGAQGRTLQEKVILLTPQGKVFNQAEAKRLSTLDHLILIAGHYEGVDERVRSLVDEEVSIGDYVLTGGELPAMVVVDAVVRLIPGVLGEHESLKEESFNNSHTTERGSYALLEYPQYTRPEEFKGMKVPDVLLSGNHAEIAKWRKEQALEKTKKRRPDLLKENAQ